MENLQVYDVAIIPLIVGLVALLTSLGMSKKYAPAASVLLGVVVGIVYMAPMDPKQGVLLGVSAGLAAVGLYSGTKNTIEKE